MSYKNTKKQFTMSAQGMMDYCSFRRDTHGIAFLASKFAVVSFQCMCPGCCLEAIISCLEVKISNNPPSFVRSYSLQFVVSTSRTTILSLSLFHFISLKKRFPLELFRNMFNWL